MTFVRSITVLLLLFAFAKASMAGETFDPKRMRKITPTTASSTCIGQPVTPICALDTFLACIARADGSLCQRVGLTPDWTMDPPHEIRYRILSVSYYPKSDLPQEIIDKHWSKNTYAIIWYRDSDSRKYSCKGEECIGSRTFQYFRPHNDEWHYLDSDGLNVD